MTLSAVKRKRSTSFFPRVKSIGLDLSYQIAYYEDRAVTDQVTNAAAGTNAEVNGTYRTTIHAGGVSLRFNF